jgi:hypothetical protein
MISSGISLSQLEGGFTLIVVALSFAFPNIGFAWFSRIERAFGRLAKRKALSVAVVGLSVILLRLAILPLIPVPLPFLPDDFSFLLSGDTFALGRLSNPTPAMWIHFESFHIDMIPTYMSMYFPGVGLVLAAGKVLFGHPWFGILIVNALMCAAICWMLQAWLPPTWALLGGALAVLRLALFSYWINTYTGGGAIAALGGALVLGALPRLIRSGRFRYLTLIAVGIVFIVYTRPYEGMLLCLPVAIVLARWAFFGKNRPGMRALLQGSVVPLAILISGAAWLGYYDYRVFASPFTLPYTINRATYAIAPYYVWQRPRPEPAYRHEVMRAFYENERSNYASIHSLSGYPRVTLLKAVNGLLFYGGFALLAPLVMIRRVFLDRRVRFLVLCLPLLIAGMAIEVFFIPHYVAPFTAVFYAIGLQCTRHLRQWNPGGRPVGRTMVRLSLTLCVILGGMRIYRDPLHMSPGGRPSVQALASWAGPGRYGTERAEVEKRLDQLPGEHLAIVRDSPDHDPGYDWVYNSPDIDGSKVIWAREMDAASDEELIRYYRNRKVWLVQPDLPANSALSLYPMPEKMRLASR